MKLKKIGFFENLEPNARKRLISELISPEPPANKQEVLSYLQSGLELFVMPGFAFDRIQSDEPIIGTLVVLTDGEWAWTSDVQYYLRLYNLKLPEEFNDHIKKLNWKMPRVKGLRKLRV